MNFVPLCNGVVTSQPDGTVTCSVAWIYVEYNPLFPAITMSDAYLIMTSVTLLFAVAWGFKQLVKFIQNR